MLLYDPELARGSSRIYFRGSMSINTIGQHLRHAVDEAVLFFHRLSRVLWIKYSNGGDVEKIAQVVQERWNNANNAITLEHLFFFEPNQIRQFKFLTKADLRNAIDQTSIDSTKRAFQYLLNVQLQVDAEMVGRGGVADAAEIDYRMDMYNEELQINTYEGDRGAFSDATEIDHHMDRYNEDLQINTYEGDRGAFSDATEIDHHMDRYNEDLQINTYEGDRGAFSDATEIDHHMDRYNEDLQINTYEGDRGAFSDATEIDHHMDRYNEDLQINTYEGDRGALSDATEIEYLMQRYFVPAPLPPAPPPVDNIPVDSIPPMDYPEFIEAETDEPQDTEAEAANVDESSDSEEADEAGEAEESDSDVDTQDHAKMITKFGKLGSKARKATIATRAQWLTTVSDDVATDALKATNHTVWLRLLKALSPHPADNRVQIVAQQRIKQIVIRLYLDLGGVQQAAFKKELDEWGKSRTFRTLARSIKNVINSR